MPRLPLTVFDEHDQIDDQHDSIPMMGLLTASSLKDRFVRRLCKTTGYIITLQEWPGEARIDIYLSGSRTQQSACDDSLNEFLEHMEKNMAVISVHGKGTRYDRARDELWDAVLIYVYDSIDEAIKTLRLCLCTNNPTFEDFITKYFGINEETGSKLDLELGNHLLKLQNLVLAYDCSMKQVNALIYKTTSMTRALSHLQDRLKYLLGKKKFADELYHLICIIGFPERAHGTFVRAAKTARMFANTKLHFGTAPDSPRQPRSANTLSIRTKLDPATLPQALPHSNVREKKLDTIEQATLIVPPPSMEKKKKGREDDLLGAAKPFLSPSDMTVSLVHLPRAKRDVIQLIKSVFHGNLVPLDSSAYYVFGFVTCATEDEERHLAGCYAALLKQARDREAIFRELVTAVETNTLVKLLDNEGFGDFRRLFPQLECFLMTPPTERWTVWKLKQFVQLGGDSEEIPVCLKQDYGFCICKQPEDVAQLKCIYVRILQEVSPMDLHYAMVHRRLVEFVLQKLRGRK